MSALAQCSSSSTSSSEEEEDSDGDFLNAGEFTDALSRADAEDNQAATGAADTLQRTARITVAETTAASVTAGAVAAGASASADETVKADPKVEVRRVERDTDLAATEDESPLSSASSAIVSVATKTALPEGCFQLTKINDAGLKVSVLAKANENGEMEILDGDDVRREEFLGDIDEVIENMQRLRLEESLLERPKDKADGSTNKADSESVTAPGSGSLKTSAGRVFSYAQKLASRSQHAESTGSSVSSSSLADIAGGVHLVRTRSHRRNRQMLSSLTLAQTIDAHKNAIWKLSFEPVLSFDTPFLLATGGQDKVVRVWTCELQKCNSSGMSCDRSSSGEADASSRVSTPECNLRDEWRLAEVPFREYSGHTLDVVDLTWSPRNISGGRYLLSASLDKTVRLWHTSKKTVCLCVFAHPKCVTSVDFHPSTKQLRFVSGCFDSKVRIWDIESGSVVQWKQVQNRVTSCCFRPDGNIVCVGLMNGVVVFLHTDGLKFYTQVECRNRRGKHRKGRKVTGVVYSPTVIDKSSGAATLLVSTNDSRLRAFRTTDFAQVMKYKGLRNNSLQISASYSPDGSTIMSGSEDGRVVVWRAAHDWYNPGSATARITGYSKVKNNSYESFDSTEGKVCTATGFLPCVSSPIELAELSAARKLAAGTISRLEYNKVVQMLERDGMRLNLEAATGHAGVECKALAADLEKRAFHGIVTVDYEGQMKLFTHAVPAHSTDAAAKATAGESEVTEHKSRPQNGDAEKGDKEEDEELSAGESPVVPARSLNIIAAMSSPPALPPKPVAKTQKEKSTPPSMPPRPSSRISLINEE